jgi:Zn-dependent protease
MHTATLLDGLRSYVFILVIITLHEFGHAWMASRCGDQTARSLGRVTLNPIAHMDLIGTVVLPLLVVLLAATGATTLAGFIIGWGKPVPVNPNNLRRPVRDDILVAMAGPVMNVLLSLVVVGLVRVAVVTGANPLINPALMLALLSMFLCFFNLLPIPPLDGSHVMKHLVRMRQETFFNLCRYGFFIVILVMQIQAVQKLLQTATWKSVALMLALFRVQT